MKGKLPREIERAERDKKERQRGEMEVEIE